MKRLFILCIGLLTAGCSGLPPLQPGASLQTEQAFLQQAKKLDGEAHWSQAVDLLNRGLVEYPESRPIRQLRDRIRKTWRLKKHGREDWMLVYDTEALKNKLPHLEALAELDPENYIIRSRLLFWRSVLSSKVSGLLACGERHLSYERKLASRCVKLAHQIEPSEHSEYLRKRLSEAEEVSRQRREVRIKRDRQQQREQLLVQARQQLSTGAYQESTQTLQQALELKPGDPDATKLLSTVIQTRDIEVDKLLAQGDQLYREELIEQAVTVWESAEKMAPGRQDIALRIDRAMRVLEKLHHLQQAE